MLNTNFDAETEKGIFDAILKEEVDFVGQPWPSISNSAKDLVQKMLTKDPKKRITPAEVLGNVPIKSSYCNELLLHKKIYFLFALFGETILILDSMEPTYDVHLSLCPGIDLVSYII